MIEKIINCDGFIIAQENDYNGKITVSCTALELREFMSRRAEE